MQIVFPLSALVSVNVRPVRIFSGAHAGDPDDDDDGDPEAAAEPGADVAGDDCAPADAAPC
jgi:hypothetical protein